MLFAPEALLPLGPPPQSVLDKQPYWQLLMVLLTVALALRIVALDVIGSVLLALLLSLAVLMLRDGMQEMPRYVLVYAVLCSLCFIFDAVPLLSSLGGRTEVHVQRVGAPKAMYDITEVMYRQTVKTRPFFDPSQGLAYNAMSAAMIVAPIALLLGAYLSIRAYFDIQENAPVLFEDLPPAPAAPPQPPPQGGAGAGARASGLGGGLGAAWASGVRPAAARQPVGQLERFQGRGHRLEDLS